MYAIPKIHNVCITTKFNHEQAVSSKIATFSSQSQNIASLGLSDNPTHLVRDPASRTPDSSSPVSSESRSPSSSPPPEVLPGGERKSPPPTPLDEYFVKPLDSHELAQRLTRHITAERRAALAATAAPARDISFELLAETMLPELEDDNSPYWHNIHCKPHEFVHKVFGDEASPVRKVLVDAGFTEEANAISEHHGDESDWDGERQPDSSLMEVAATLAFSVRKVGRPVFVQNWYGPLRALFDWATMLHRLGKIPGDASSLDTDALAQAISHRQAADGDKPYWLNFPGCESKDFFKMVFGKRESPVLKLMTDAGLGKHAYQLSMLPGSEMPAQAAAMFLTSHGTKGSPKECYDSLRALFQHVTRQVLIPIDDPDQLIEDLNPSLEGWKKLTRESEFFGFVFGNPNSPVFARLQLGGFIDRFHQTLQTRIDNLHQTFFPGQSAKSANLDEFVEHLKAAKLDERRAFDIASGMVDNVLRKVLYPNEKPVNDKGVLQLEGLSFAGIKEPLQKLRQAILRKALDAESAPGCTIGGLFNLLSGRP